jgi:hypothetical protein
MATKVNCRPFTIPTLPGLGLADIEKRFRRMTHLMYDTSVPASVLAEEVYPYLAPDIEFVNPWRRVRGVETYQIDLSGTHRGVHGDLDIAQMNARLSERRDAGRVLVDSTLSLRLLPRRAYRLRMILTYDFEMLEEGERFHVTRHEEMWSVGDILQSLPLAGRGYDVLRSLSGYVFTGAVLLSRAVAGRLSGAERGAPAPAR